MFDAAAQESFEHDGFARLSGLIPPPVLERPRAFINPLQIPARVIQRATNNPPQQALKLPFMRNILIIVHRIRTAEDD
ncbi:hypothetical protein [Citromicrobium bathyomarinum]|uniref:hypothetical protein n=1 Tax=Citromicrobium bathyomarinum TaxID=72174 RepID=UPI00315B2212